VSVTEEVSRLAEPVLREAGVELVHLEYQREPHGWTLRFYLDKEGGFGLADCQLWSDRLGDLLDAGGVPPGDYALEVSSPGLNRPLRKPEDYRRFLGMDAVIRLYASQDGQKNFHGRLASLENDELTLQDRTSGFVRIPLASIASARLDPPAGLD
jgi:ribosome maturation factor RimP